MSADAGIIVTQQGVAVKGAADYQKTIDTRWRFLEISEEREFEIIHSDSGSTHYWLEKIMDHNLGYLPAFTYRQKSLDLGGLNPIFYDPGIVATNTSIYQRRLYVAGDPTTPMILKGYLRVFALDITKEYQAPVDLIFAGIPASANDIGVKILKNTGAGMRSNEMSDYSLNTQAKALAIQQTGVRSATLENQGTLTIQHNLGYPPTYFTASTLTTEEFDGQTIWNNPLEGETVIYPMENPVFLRVTANATQVIMRGAQAALIGNFAILVTKEPAELAI